MKIYCTFEFMKSLRISVVAMSYLLPMGYLHAVLLFSKLNNIFVGYFDPENIFLDNENK